MNLYAQLSRISGKNTHFQHTRSLVGFKDIFGKKKGPEDRKAKPNEFDNIDDSTFNEKMTQDTEFRSLADKSSRLVRRKAYKPVVPEVEGFIKNLCMQSFANEFNEKTYKDLKLDNGLIKFRLLSECVSRFGHDISNTSLNDMKTVSDLVTYYLTEQKDTNTLEDIQQKPDLPKNLHIATEYMRFDPKTDMFFEGKDAYPDRDTIVSSLWYSKKYKTIKKEKKFATK